MGNLAELAGRDPERLAAAAGSALRAALQRHVTQSAESGRLAFQSFIGADD
ncbi:hypothetical protein ACIRRA_39605 [Nocardia sp. NPDC101769]|uniref:hypothetical protein n=1 Tax=Nocardia sp. NPDC101769 TaxID=3364333 RepID=UPI0037F4FD3A